MAGSLAQVDTYTVSTAAASIVIGGGSSSSSGIDFAINTDDVYMLTYINFQGSVNDKYPYMRVTESGTVNTGNNYNYAGRKLKLILLFNKDMLTIKLKQKYKMKNLATKTRKQQMELSTFTMQTIVQNLHFGQRKM